MMSIAIVGATGLVGQEFLKVLDEQHFPVDQLYLLASENSTGKVFNFRGKAITVKNVAGFDFSKVRLAFFSAGSEVSEKYAPIAVAAGAVVIDNTAYFRQDKHIPLVIPEINAHLVKGLKSGIISNPNCSTIQLLLAVKPILDAAGLLRMDVSTYQSVSGAGQAGMDELLQQTRDVLANKSITPKEFSHPIAFNVIPRIDGLLENGFTKEEMKMVQESQKIFDLPDLEVGVTTVRVPVLRGHSMAAMIQTDRSVSVAEVMALMRSSPRLRVFEGYEVPTPVNDGIGTDLVSIGRVRKDLFNAKLLNLWIVSDNLRTGAAFNAVQIAKVVFG